MSEPLLLIGAGPVAELRFSRLASRNAIDASTARAQLDAERDAFAASADTQDVAEGLHAFFDKQPVRFQDR